MSVIILFGAILVTVFAVAFVSSRRFGPLALALATGFLLSEWWGSWLMGVLDGLKFGNWFIAKWCNFGISLNVGSVNDASSKWSEISEKHERIISAVGIAFLTAALLVVSMGKYISLDGQALELYKDFRE